MIQTININEIYMRLFDKNMVTHPYKIENSPHYKALCGDKKAYEDYYNLMESLGRAKSGYMNYDEFFEFNESFNYLESPYEQSYITVKNVDGGFQTADGDHRLACEFKKGSKEITVDVVDMEFKWEGYSNLINIAEIFDGLSDYIIIKDDDDIPNYRTRDDVDIICRDRYKLRDKILERLETYKDKGFTIRVTEKEVRTHIDVYPPENGSSLNFRFDLIDSFPYKIGSDIEVSESYFDLILERSVSKSFSPSFAFFGNDVEILFPNRDDDLVLRFLEWTWRPDKVRHISYVKNNLKNTHNFVKILNEYTNIEIDNDYIKGLFDDLLTIENENMEYTL